HLDRLARRQPVLSPRTERAVGQAHALHVASRGAGERLHAVARRGGVDLGRRQYGEQAVGRRLDERAALRPGTAAACREERGDDRRATEPDIPGSCGSPPWLWAGDDGGPSPSGAGPYGYR